MANNNRNSLVVQGSERAIEQFKLEVAEEIGLHNYQQMDKGWLASRQNGYVGGNMTKKMVAYAELAMEQQGSQIMTNVQAVVEVSPEVRQLNEMASQNFEGFKSTLAGIQQQGGTQGMGLEQQGQGYIQ